MTDAARDDRPTEVYPTEVLSPTVAAPEPPRRRGRAGRAWIIVVAVLIAIGVVLVVADVVTRNIAERRFGEQIRMNLPDGVDGEVDVTIGGFSVLAQYLTGTMERVELSAPELIVQGAPISVDVNATGVPVDLASPVASITGTISAEEDALNRLVAVPGVNGAFSLGEGTVGYAGTFTLLGFSLDYSATARPTAAGDSVLLVAEEVKVESGVGVVDVSVAVNRLLGDDPIAVCVAQYLPDGVQVTAIEIDPGFATVELAGSGITLDEASLATKGACG